MNALLELLGAWLATAYAVYGFAVLFLPTVLFAYVPVLAASVWMAIAHDRGRRPWPRIPPRTRRWTRLGVEVLFGLVNPVIYLVILTPALPDLRGGQDWGLSAAAWILLVAFWSTRIVGAALDPASRRSRTAVGALLWAALACVLLHAAKDASLAWRTDWGRLSWLTVAVNVLRVCPLYLVPAVLLWDHARGIASCTAARGEAWYRLFLLPDRAARATIAGAVVLAGITLALVAHRRSDATVRQLVVTHRAPILAAAHQYEVDPRLIAAIVYVTHRDQHSPFRDALERVAIGAWASNLRAQFDLRPPDRVQDVGTDENPLLDVALDISVGLAQIKPRTAQTASVLATGRLPGELPDPVRFGYRSIEPLGQAWGSPERRRVLPSPVAVPAARWTVADALLDARTNLAMCALILALYQDQWETASPAWGIRHRPDILATLYQLGFARSVPHATPRSNAFGTRVAEVTTQAWLTDLFGSRDGASPATPGR